MSKSRKDLSWDSVRLAAAFNGKSDSDLMQACEGMIHPDKEPKLTEEQARSAQMLKNAFRKQEV